MGTVRDIPNEKSCPTPRELVAFNIGSLPPPMLEAISDHLSECTRCLLALETLPVEEGSAIQELRRSLQQDSVELYPFDAEYRRMEEEAYEYISAERVFESSPRQAVQVRGGGALLPHSEEPPAEFLLGQYRVLERIGKGGMGTVHRAIHIRLKKAVAIKILPPERTGDAHAIARFQREMEAVGRLDHEHIVRATDAGEFDGIHFLVMELIEGMDLSRLVRSTGPLGVADACEIVRQAALGLQCAHENDLVHRDIKPSNLFLSSKGVVKVLDLGLALLSQKRLPSGALTFTGQVMGTADYMAPEQWEASHEVDIRADLYSLGCTLYTLLAGRPPFDGPEYKSTVKKMAAHIHVAVPAISNARSDIPVALTALLDRLLAKNPAVRPDTPALLAQALEPFCGKGNLPRLLQVARQRWPETPEEPNDLPTIASPGSETGPRLGPGLLAQEAPRPIRVLPVRWLPAVAVVGLLAVGVAVLGANLGWLTGKDSATSPTQPVTEPDAPYSFKVNTWNNLLKQPPREFYWFNPANASFWNFDPAGERIRVQTVNRSLLTLGKVETSGYTLSIGLRQERWVGGIGVFFGGTRDPKSGSLRYQTIELREGPVPDGLTFVLHRGKGAIEKIPGKEAMFVNKGVNSWRLPKAPSSAEQYLSLSVNRNGLVGVHWNGIECERLVDGAAGPLKDVNYYGYFGVYFESASGQITSGRIMPTE